MSDPIQRIVQFNEESGLLERGYDDFLESSFIIEEALEGFDDLELLYASVSDTPPKSTSLAKECSRNIVSSAGTFKGTDVDRIDKFCDAIVFSVGAMAKLGLSAEDINKALNIVMDANNSKVGCEKDELGKLKKPDNFPNPEPRLQELLDNLT